MAPSSLRLCHRLSVRHQPKSLLQRSSKILCTRSLTSATPRSNPPSTRLHQHAHIQSPSNPIPNLCLGAGGKAPGFVQQMLFSAPTQDKVPKEQMGQDIRAFLGDASTRNRSVDSPRPSHTFKP